MSGKERGTTKVGEKVFSDNFTLKSDIGNPILRQTPIGPDGLAGAAESPGSRRACSRTSSTTRLGQAAEEGPDATATNVNMSLVMEGRT